jgi:RNA polymerase sigma-70 factor (ECF subfamily)
MVRLSPQERAAVVLKDVFDLTLEEVAETLSTTVGAVKAALHRGRGKLTDPAVEESSVAVPAVLNAFCEAFNAHDIDRVAALLLDRAEVEVVGTHIDYGPDAAKTGALYGMLFGSQKMANAENEAAMDPRFIQKVLPVPPRCEVRVHRGEALLLLWYRHEDGEFVRGINRAVVEGDRVSKFRNYFFNPDFLIELCGELGVPCRVNGHLHCSSPALAGQIAEG